jgi:hypothetical protein
MIGVAGISLGLNLASSVLGTRQQKAEYEAAVKQAEQQHEMNIAATRLALDTLGMRVSRQASEIERDRIRSEISVQKQAYTAKGEQAVKSAQLGITGRRAELYDVQDIERKQADIESDIATQAETERYNLKSQHLDTARKAIVNLNNAVPDVNQPMSALTAGLQSVAAGASAYASLDTKDRAQFNKNIRDYFD